MQHIDTNPIQLGGSYKLETIDVRVAVTVLLLPTILVAQVEQSV